MAQLHDLTAVAQAAAVRRGEVSPTELVTHYLDRVVARSAAIGAFVTVTASAALGQARAAEGLLREVAGDVALLPPLLGVPTAIKDLDAVAGVPMKLGSRAFADHVPDWDDHVVTLLRRAGTISLGKTNTPEFGLPCYTEPDPTIAPPARTPWDLARSAGGSSGGAAAAVAAGLVPFAQGSDGGGSIRIPASACGLVGLKPTRGRISNGPRGSDFPGLATKGPLARSVADAAALLDAMAGAQPGDPFSAPPLPPGETFLAQVGRDPGQCRIGRYRDNLLDAPLDPQCLAAWEDASGLLAGFGHEVLDVPRPDLTGLYEHFAVLWATGAAAGVFTDAQEQLLTPLTRHLRAQGARVAGAQYLRSLSVVTQAARRHLEATWELDAVLTPTLAQLPAPVGGLRDDSDPAGDFAAQERFTPYTATYNVTGQPAVSVPTWWTDAGVPVGVQLVGRTGEEGLLLRLAGQLEAVVGWQERHPAQW